MVIKSFVNMLFSFLLFFIVLQSCSDLKDKNEDEYLNKEINNAKITDLEGFYFVGNNSGIPSLYWYDFKKDKSKLFWQENNERVIDLLISSNNRSAYFITKRKQRLKSSQPAIERGKLYRLDFETKKVESIAQLEEGIQVIPFWLDKDRFALVINSVDKTIASYINKNTQIYNRFGKLLSDNTEVFDLTKDGYPITNIPTLNYNSPNELFTVADKGDSIVIKQIKYENEIKTDFVNEKILQIDWAENNKNLIMLLIPSTEERLDINVYRGSRLVIYDLKLRKTVKIINAVGFKHFALIGDFLIFDKGIGKDSQIEIIKLDSLKNIKTIKLNGGCSIRNI